MTQSTDVTTVDDEGGAGTSGPDRVAEDRDAVDDLGVVGQAQELLVAEGDAAGDYLEQFLDILDYDGDIDLDVEGERAVVSIVGGGEIENLIGDDGEVLDAVQELTRLAASTQTGQRSRLMLDIAGYRAKLRRELTELGTRTANEVVSSGEAVRLDVMNPFERKVVHDAVSAVDGVTSSSEGVEPRRRVVISPAA